MLRLIGIRRLLARYRRAENGAIIPLVGLAFVVLVGMMGMAIDIGRAQLVEAKLLNSLDAAGLAAGAKMNTLDVNAEVQRFVAANFPDGYADATISNVTGTLSADELTITVTGTAVVPTTFMRIFGYNSLDINVSSEITREVGGLELVLVLDNTTSMSGSGITNLKAAANDLLDIVYGSDDVGNNLYVGVVPFSDTVNVGTAHTAWLTPGSVASYDWGPSGYTWGGCVMARYSSPNLDVTDDPPSVRKFAPFYWEDDDEPGTPSANTNDWKDTVYAQNEYGPDDLYGPDYFERMYGAVGAEVQPASHNGGTCTSCSCNSAYCTPTTVYNTPFSVNKGPNKYCPVPVTPMTPTKATVVSAISALSANGYTHINLGAVWGWRMLSPQWRGLWGGTMDANDLPLDYGTDHMNKAIVIMTDGDNRFASAAKTAYGWLSQGNIGTTNASTAEGYADQRLSTVCTAMKNAGIYVYTITYGTDVTDTTRTLMRNCATQADYFFDAPAGAELTTAFKKIGDSLSNLRISK